MKYIRIAVLLLATSVASGCLHKRNTMVLKGEAPTPTIFTSGYTLESASAAGVHAWADGERVYIRKLPFKPNPGDPRVCGNFGQAGKSWSDCYGHGVIDHGEYVSFPAKEWREEGLFMIGESYCGQLRYGDKAERNWNNNHTMPEGTAYLGPRLDPNTPLYFDGTGMLGSSLGLR